MINIIAPINLLGYGVTGLNIVKYLSNIMPVSLWPLGPMQVYNHEDIDIITQALECAKIFDTQAPCVKIWHQNDMAQFVGKGERIGFPIFELNQFNNVEKHHLESLDRIFVCSHWAKDVILNCININENLVHVVPLGVDTNIFKPSQININNNKTIFFNCGKWEIRKGHDIIYDIFEQAFKNDDEVELWMMTNNPFLSPEEDKNWKNLYLNRKLGHKIKFIDRVATHEEVYNIMKQVDCGIFPSRAEGWNLELLEMLACGRHVITTNYSAHTEFCNSENSYLVDINQKELAYDGKWFHGHCGEWAKISIDQIKEFAQHMRHVHEKKKQNQLYINNNGVKTANSFSWSSSASTIKKILYD